MKPFDVEKDYKTFNAWWTSHGEKPIPMEALPGVGFINDGACCFLVQTDSHFALIEFLTVSRENRRSRFHLLEVVKACIEEARKLGFSNVIAPLQQRSVINLAKNKFGWKSLGPVEFMAKELF
jgi:hypothetical protein